MSNKDNTDTYLNIHSDQFNSWVKEFEVKYQKVEDSTNIKNNLDSFNNSELEDSDIEDSEEIQFSDVDAESSNVFLAEGTNYSENSSGSKLLYKRNMTRIRKSDTSEKKNSIKNRKNLTLSESTSSEKKLVKNTKEKEIIKEKNYEDIISLNQLNSMIPKFNNRTSKKNNEVEKDKTVVSNKPVITPQKKLGEHALYKFIINRRR